MGPLCREEEILPQVNRTILLKIMFPKAISKVMVKGKITGAHPQRHFNAVLWEALLGLLLLTGKGQLKHNILKRCRRKIQHPTHLLILVNT
jgi:hypothetical protein